MDDTLKYLKKVEEGMLGMTNSLAKTLENFSKNLTKDEAEKFHRTMIDSRIKDIADANVEAILKMNKTTHD